DFTFVYPTEILAFNDELPEFSRLNTTVLGTPSLAPTRFSGTATWAMREYGCLIEDNGITFRASYLIDSKGVQITTNDLPVGRSVDDVLHLVQAFQFTDTHGEVCHAN
ncbi:peroxiredoxin-1, partial [Lactarius indigo]